MHRECRAIIAWHHGLGKNEKYNYCSAIGYMVGNFYTLFEQGEWTRNNAHVAYVIA
jgi:hypothetical protein